MKLEVEVVGLDVAFRRLKKLEAKTALNKIRAAVRFAVKPTIALAKAKVPQGIDSDSYHLRDNIVLQAESKRYRFTAAQYRLGPARVGAGPGDTEGYAIAGGLGKKATTPNYAGIIEDDTPYLKPAFDATDEQIVRRFGQKITQSVNAA